MTNSIVTDPAGLASIAATTAASGTVADLQNTIATGLAVSSPADNGAIFAISEGLSGDIGQLTSVTSNLAFTQGTLDVAEAGATVISDGLNSLAALATDLGNGFLSDSQSALLQQSFSAQLADLQSFASAASFNGINLLDGSSAGFSVVAGVDGSSLSIPGTDLASALAAITVPTSPDEALALLDPDTGALAAAQASTAETLGSLGSTAQSVDAQLAFANDLLDATTVGQGALVDADIAESAADLSAATVQQELAVIAQGITSSSEASILSLFEGVS